MMTSLIRTVRNTERVIKANSPVVLGSLAAFGVVTSVYLTARATWRASEIIHQKEAVEGTNSDPKERFKERASYTWKEFLPPAVSVVSTVGCVLGAVNSGNRKTAVAMTAASVSERAFNEYREKVVEQLGVKKEELIRDEVAQDAIRKEPPNKILVAGGGEVLCCERYTMRYFESDMQTLRKAQNDINAMLMNELYATLNDFYFLIGLEQTHQSGDIGWDSDKLLELEFSTVMSGDDRPCLAFSYNYTKII